MSYINKTGEVVHTSGEMILEWNIRDFPSLSCKVGDFYESPVVNFADSTWCLNFYPKGDRRTESSGWMGLYLKRTDSKPCNRTLFFTFGYKDSGVLEEAEEIKYEFSPKNTSAFGFSKLWSRSKFLDKESGILQNNVLTITCRLKWFDSNSPKASLGNRLVKVSREVQTLLNSGKRSDFTLKVGEVEWPVHKVILKSRCKYFENMFRHAWVENTMHEVKFDHMNEKALDSVLQFIYTGVVKEMSGEDACEIYVAACRFLLDDLRALCVQTIKRTMSVGTVLKALHISHKYGEEDLKERATEFYIREHYKINQTAEWAEFGQNNWSIVKELIKEICYIYKILKRFV